MRLVLLRIYASGMGLVLCLSCLPMFTQAQDQEDKWRRVFTGEEFIVDVNPESLRFESSHLFRAKFRTIFSHVETSPGNPATKYKTRVETLEFKSTEKRYRILETSLLDSTGKSVQSWTNPSQEWKIPKDGGVMERLLVAARGLPPLGLWKVIAYRYAEGGPNLSNEPRELTKLVGTLVRLNVDTAEVGTNRCPSPAYQSSRLTDEEFRRESGTSLNLIGIRANEVDVIVIKCETSGWSPPQSLLIKLPENGGMLMLWEGVFLVLKGQR